MMRILAAIGLFCFVMGLAAEPVLPQKPAGHDSKRSYPGAADAKTSEAGPDFSGAKLKIDAPFSTATLKIKSDGRVFYHASSPDTGIDKLEKAKKVGKKDISRLLKVIKEGKFFSLKKAYPYREGFSYEDASAYTIEVTLKGKKKKVSCYGPECPEKFIRVMKAIKEIWGEDILEVGT